MLQELEVSKMRVETRTIGMINARHSLICIIMDKRHFKHNRTLHT